MMSHFEWIIQELQQPRDCDCWRHSDDGESPLNLCSTCSGTGAYRILEDDSEEAIKAALSPYLWTNDRGEIMYYADAADPQGPYFPYNRGELVSLLQQVFYGYWPAREQELPVDITGKTVRSWRERKCLEFRFHVVRFEPSLHRPNRFSCKACMWERDIPLEEWIKGVRRSESD